MFLDSARNILETVRIDSDSIGVAYSGGKDSAVVLDMCCDIFNRVEAYYMYRVPGLAVIDRLCLGIKKRYGVDVRHYPHFDLARCFRHAVLQPHWRLLDKTPSLTARAIESHFRKEANVSWIAYGWRRSDSRSRAIILSQNRGIDIDAMRAFPLRVWRRKDVIAYLRQRRIPIPPSFGREEQGGVDFHPATLSYLRQYWPGDYKKIKEFFPYAEAQITPAD